MLHIKLKIIRLLFYDKEILKGFTIYGHGGHLGNVTKIIFVNMSPIL